MVYKIDDSTLERVKERLLKMEGEVELILFTEDKDHCVYCNDIEEMADQIHGLSDKLKIVKGLDLKSDEAKKNNIDKHPAMIIKGKNRGIIRYLGMPMMHEFLPFIDTIVDVSTGKPDLSKESIEKLSKINKPIHIQVFTTPTCPYCPAMARNAHKAAMINENITGDMIDAMEFMHLAQEYKVSSVPRTFINEKTDILGAVSEKDFVDKLVETQ